MIRLPDIPQLPSSQIGYRKSSTDGLLVNSAQAARSAALPGLEMTSLANAVGEVSDAYWSILGQVQKGEDSRTTNEGKRELAKAYSDHSTSPFIQEDFDPASRIQKTRQFFENYKKNINFDDVSKNSQAEILNNFEDVATEGMIRQADEAMKMGVKRSLLATENSVNEFMANQNLPAAVETVRGQPNMNEEEKNAVIFKLKAQNQIDRHSVEMNTDPILWLSKYRTAEDAGVDAVTHLDLTDKANRILGEHISESTDDAFDQIAASWIANKEDSSKAGINKADAIGKFGGLPEKTRVALGEYAEKLATGAFNEKRITDRFVNQTTGDVKNLIRKYRSDRAVIPGLNPEQDEDERQGQRLAILERINLLLPGPSRDYLRSLLDEKEQLIAHEIKTNLDLALKDLETFDEAGKFGRLPVPKPMKIEQVTRSKFLKDKKKLQSLGISDLDIESITNEATNTKQVAAFQKAYPKRGEMVGADDLTIATAEAILNGSSDIGFISTEERNVYFAADERANEKLGRYMIQLQRISKSEPTISYDKLYSKLIDMIDSDKRAEESQTTQ